MAQAGYYPAGAYEDSRAPYNEPISGRKSYKNPNYDYDHVEEFLAWMRGEDKE